MPYAPPPAKNEISATPSPSNAVAKAGFGKFWDMVTGLLGLSGNPEDAHAALKILDPEALYNLKLDFTLPGANALRATLTDKDGNALGAANPGYVAHRAALGSGGFNMRKIAAAITLDVPAGATLGHASGVPAPLFWYLIEKDAGVEKIAVCGTFLGYSGRFSTTLISVAADLANVLYADEALADKPGRLGWITWDTQAAAGTWTAAPTKVQPAPFTVIETGIAPGGRLTLTSGVPVTSADVAGAAAVYYTPYKHNVIELYDGAGAWVRHHFQEVSQATADAAKSPAAVAASKNYDMYFWDDAGTLRCTRGPTWDAGAVAGSDTARGTGAGSTELERFEGRLVNKNDIVNGPAARRGLYVGSIRSDGASQINDKGINALRHVWNAYNRAPRSMSRVEAADSWTYTLNVWRQANANVANQFEALIGLAEDEVSVSVQGLASNSGTVEMAVGVGLNSTTVNSANTFGATNPTGANMSMHAHYRGQPGIGRRFFPWLEISEAGGTTTWRGDNGGVRIQTGMFGEVLS